MRILVLVHSDCVPPAQATVAEADWAVWKTEYYVVKALKKLKHLVRVVPLESDLAPLEQALAHFSPNLVFNLMVEFQGRASFESHIPAFLEMKGVPYTGCNPLGLSLSRDKALSKDILKTHGIKTPQYLTVQLGQKVPEKINLRFPVIVKSLTEEASLGISQTSVVQSWDKLVERVQFIHKSLGTGALIEEYIPGRELYVGVLGQSNLTVFPPWELHFGRLQKDGVPIATRQVKFSRQYGEKHQIKRGPAQGLDRFTMQRLQKLSRDSYKALKLSGYARMDFRLSPEGELYLLEANPNAELAKGECFANAAKLHGWGYDQLIGKLVSLGRSYQLAA